MIKEIITYITTPANKLSRKYGFLHQSIALEARAKRCLKKWQPHLDHCHNLLESEFKKLPKTSSVCVLGSGLLLETPLELLSKYFTQIYLIDLVHLRSVRQKVLAFKKVNPNIKVDFLESDLSGLFENTKPPYYPKLSLPKTDIIISSNYLSQLAIIPSKYIKKSSKNKINENELCYKITADHFEWLKSLNTPTLLICDHNTEIRDPENKTIQFNKPHYNFKLPTPIQTWSWELAPIGELSSEYSMQLTVSGFWINHKLDK